MKIQSKRPTRTRGSVLLMTLVYTLLFGALAAAMSAFAIGNMRLGLAETESNRALSAAESGMSYLLAQLHQCPMPIITEGSIANMASPSTLWSGSNIESNGNSGIGVQLAAGLNQCGAFVVAGSTVATPTGTTALSCPAIAIDPTSDNSSFTLKVVWDSANPHVVSSTTSYIILHLTSTGKSGMVSRTVTMDVQFQKTLKYAVYSNVAIQIGKNVRVQGDVASAYNGTGKGPPIQMFSDFHYMADLSTVDSNLNALRTLLATYDSTYSNRLDVRDPNSQAAIDAKNAGLKDLNGDGYIDDYDVGLKSLDSNSNKVITQGEFTDPVTGKPYDQDLWNLIDTPMGAQATPPWTGYGDGQIDNNDGYAKVNGSVKMALSQAQWQSALSGWSQYGDSGGTRSQDMIEGPIEPTDPSQAPVQFGYDFSSDLSMTPQNFDTSGFDSSSKIPTTAATVSTSGGNTNISNGTLTAAMANGTSVTEHSPADVTSGWQATYSRPVFQNINFNNVRIPKGLNAKFVNCTFNGYTSVKMNTNIVQAGTSTTTYDPSQGQAWAQQMTNGTTFNANTTLTASNSTAYTQGNNLHFSDCTFNGVLSADVPTAYTHFADSWEFDGNTNINNQVDQSVTIIAPNTNIEMGSYVDPSGSPSTLVGVVVAGNIDIRGSAVVDGSLIVTGNGAGNTTLGYFGSTDSGQAVPPLNQLPSTANGQYGHLNFKYNPNRGMPNGIKVPLVMTAQYSTYQIQ